MTFYSRRLEQEDARVRRCTCGAWCYGFVACSTCGLGARRVELDIAISTTAVENPKKSTRRTSAVVRISAGQRDTARICARRRAALLVDVSDSLASVTAMDRPAISGGRR